MPSLVEIGRMIFGKRFLKVVNVFCYFAIKGFALRLESPSKGMPCAKSG